MEIYDISQNLCRGMAVWPGDPQFQSRWVMRVRDGASTNVSAIDMGAHTGTHVDAPLHLDDAGEGVAAASLHRFIGPARVFALEVGKCIRAEHLSGLDWQGVKRVLFRTPNSRRPEMSFDKNFIALSEDAAEFLAQKNLLLAGIDAPSVDAFESQGLPSHRILLGHGIAILEGARLENVPPGDYELICLPLKLSGLDGSPVRAILRK